VIENNKWNICDVTSGTPQEGALSPKLFNIYFLEIPKICKNCIFFQYCDDTVILWAIENQSYVNLLQEDLNNLHKYCVDLGLKFQTKNNRNIDT
jgi:hypothetical protein